RCPSSGRAARRCWGSRATSRAASKWSSGSRSPSGSPGWGRRLAGTRQGATNPLPYPLLATSKALAPRAHRGAPAGEAAKLREALESAHHGATRVAAIVGQIRASSRSDTEERGPVALRLVLEAALRVTQNEIHHRARLVTDLQDVPTLVGNAHR